MANSKQEKDKAKRAEKEQDNALDPCTQPHSNEAARPSHAEEACDEGVQ